VYIRHLDPKGAKQFGDVLKKCIEDGKKRDQEKKQDLPFVTEDKQ
jgi:hypothetical protein